MRKSRVLMAAAGLFFGLLCLWARMAWLQLGLHEHYARRAVENQEERVGILPKRGDLLDRHGRVLASDLKLAKVAVSPRELESARAVAKALGPLLGKDARRLQKQLAGAKHYSWIARDLPPETGARIRALRLPGIYVEDEVRRGYRLGDAAVELLGRTNRDHLGVDGIELQYESDLAGQAGWTTRIRNGRGGVMQLPGAEGRAARDGRDVVLTLDADLQSILETHLARAVDTLNAKRAFAVFLDPWTGEVLASACVPHLPPGQAKNWIVTDQYEPGSTFKVVVAGAAVEEGLAKPTSVFAGSATGSVEIVPGCILRDVHAHPTYTLASAVRTSSNIVMGRLGLKLGQDRVYRYASALGFGSLTGVEFPGEVAGRLRPVSAWQPRSTPTIAMGYEMSVTPLQLALAYGAIANGGVLMEPRLVRELREPDGASVRKAEPVATHRVFREATAHTLREMLTAVVDSGTATAARIPGIRIAGKTGTAKKFVKGAGGYAAGKYVGSFAGLAPADHPRIVGVVVIDEPRGSTYYGGQVAAPVFREVIKDLLRMPEGLLGPGPAAVATAPPAVAEVTAPDLRLLPPREAELRLSGYGLRVRFEGRGARVLSQEPPAGEPVERGGTVIAWLAPPSDSVGRALPDVVGMPLREALRQLSRREVPVRFEGRGFVVRQEPAAGTALPLARGARLWCSTKSPELQAGPRVTAQTASATAPLTRQHRP